MVAQKLNRFKSRKPRKINFKYRILNYFNKIIHACSYHRDYPVYVGTNKITLTILKRSRYCLIWLTPTPIYCFLHGFGQIKNCNYGKSGLLTYQPNHVTSSKWANSSSCWSRTESNSSTNIRKEKSYSKISSYLY